jgi:hypothetical protein
MLAVNDQQTAFPARLTRAGGGLPCRRIIVRSAARNQRGIIMTGCA